MTRLYLKTVGMTFKKMICISLVRVERERANEVLSCPMNGYMFHIKLMFLGSWAFGRIRLA